MNAIRIASILALMAVASAAKADCDLRFAPPEVRAAAQAHLAQRSGTDSGSATAQNVPKPAPTTISPFEKQEPKGDLLFAPGLEKQILPSPPFKKKGEQPKPSSGN